MERKERRWWLTKGSEQLVINAPAGHLYDMVADLSRMGEWAAECERVEWIDGATGPEVGARFVGHNRGGPMKKFRWSRHGRVLAAEPGRKFSFVTEEGGRESTQWHYQFEAVDGGTSVTETYDIQWLPLWARIIDGPVNRKRELHENMHHTLENLKVAAEASARREGALS